MVSRKVSYHTIGRSQQEGNQEMLHKGSTGYLKYITEVFELITIAL